MVVADSRTLNQSELNTLFGIVAFISLTCSSFVFSSVYMYGARTASTRLILYLNFALIIDELSSLPTYSHHKDLCAFMAFLKTYSEVLQIFVCLLLSFLASKLVFPSPLSTKFEVTDGLKICIFLVPLVLLMLPLATHSYGSYEKYWCSFRDDPSGNAWYDAVLVVESLLLASSALVLINIAYKLKMSSSSVSVLRLFKGVGLYSTVTLLCWLPKLLTLNIVTVALSTANATIASRLCSYLLGFLCFAIFMLEKHSTRLCLSLRSMVMGTSRESEFSHTGQASFFDEHSAWGIGEGFLSGGQHPSSTQSGASQSEISMNSANSLDKLRAAMNAGPQV